MFHTAAFTESVDQTLDNIAALADTILHTNGDDLFVPDGLGALLAIRAGSATMERARIDTATLRSKLLPDIQPVGALEPESPRPLGFHEFWNQPMQLGAGSAKGERLKVLIENDGAGSAEQATAVVWLGSGPITPSPGGWFPIRATGTTTLSANAWSNVAITLSQSLPKGEYELGGFRPESAGCIAARAVPTGGATPSYRPGVLGVDADTDEQPVIFRRGGLGVLCRFAYDQPPSFDFLSISADTAQELILDVRKVA